MKKSLLAGALFAALSLAGTASARVDNTDTIETMQARSAMIADVVNKWSGMLAGKVGAPAAFSTTLRTRLEVLSNERLELALRAQSPEELDLLWQSAPIASGQTMDGLMANRPGNLILPAEMSSGIQAKSTPAGSPDRFSDLVFTAVTPCRIYDSRFNTEVIDSKAANARWPANVPQLVKIGPYASYTTYGGQATPCLGSSGAGTQNPPSRVAAILGSISTVSQLGAGYAIFWSYGGTNPYPGGVAQFFQPGVVQTSFVVMPTDISNPVWTRGLVSASTHVIVDVVGYFHKAKHEMMASINADGTAARAFHLTNTLKLGVGTYEIEFDRDVTSCYYFGSMGGAFGGNPASGSVGVTLRGGNSNAVYVSVRDDAGAGMDAEFHVRVSCQAE